MHRTSAQLPRPCSEPSALALLLLLLLLTAAPVHAVVTLVSFTATAGDGQVLLRWETATEINNAGFFVRRSTQEAGEYARISPFIPSQGDGLIGTVYTYLDTEVENGVTYFYKLEAMENDQDVEFHGPVSATPGGPPTPTETATTTATPTATHTVAPSPTDTPAPTATATSTATSPPPPTATPAPTDTPRPATPVPATNTPTSVPTPISMDTPEPTRTPTVVPTETPSPVPTHTPTPTDTPSPTSTARPTGTPTAVSVPATSYTATLTPSPAVIAVPSLEMATPTRSPKPSPTTSSTAVPESASSAPAADTDPAHPYPQGLAGGGSRAPVDAEESLPTSSSDRPRQEPTSTAAAPEVLAENQGLESEQPTGAPPLQEQPSGLIARSGRGTLAVEGAALLARGLLSLVLLALAGGLLVLLRGGRGP